MALKIYTWRVYNPNLQPDETDDGPLEAYYSVEAAKSAARENMLEHFKELLDMELELAADQINEKTVRRLRTKLNGDYKPAWEEVKNTVGPVEQYRFYFGELDITYVVYSMTLSR